MYKHRELALYTEVDAFQPEDRYDKLLHTLSTCICLSPRLNRFAKVSLLLLLLLLLCGVCNNILRLLPLAMGQPALLNVGWQPPTRLLRLYQECTCYTHTGQTVFCVVFILYRVGRWFTYICANIYRRLPPSMKLWRKKFTNPYLFFHEFGRDDKHKEMGLSVTPPLNIRQRRSGFSGTIVVGNRPPPAALGKKPTRTLPWMGTKRRQQLPRYMQILS